MDYRFQLHSTSAHRGTNRWQFLSCVFDPGWHEDDADEMVPSLAINWLNEQSILYRVEVTTAPMDHMGDMMQDIDQLDFRVVIDDMAQAAIFRLTFPECPQV